MGVPKVFLVNLRRPNSADFCTDPFYEFGSFGCTKCHSNNLLCTRNAAELKGSRLAFAQGGAGGFRLMLLTPPISVILWSHNCEVRWKPPTMPFKYSEAPILVANDGRSDFPLVKAFSSKTARKTLEGGFASRFRSRSSPLQPEIAEELIVIYEKYRNEKGSSAIAEQYYQALPYVTRMDRYRKATYRRLISELTAEANRSPRTLKCRSIGTEKQAQHECGSSKYRKSNCRTMPSSGRRKPHR